MNSIIIALVLYQLWGSESLTWPRFIMLCLGMLVMWLASLYFFQEKMLYAPQLTPATNPAGYRSPAERNIPYEEVTLKTPDGLRLHSWLLLQPQPKEHATILFFHANAGNMGLRMDNLEAFYKLGSKYNIFVISYRGYGASDGEPGEDGMVIDAHTALAYLLDRNDIDTSRVVVFGRSLGGAVAIALASSTAGAKIKGTMLENTFRSIPAMVDHLFPILRPLQGRLLRLKWPSEDRIAHVKHPLLFLAGAKDEIVPPTHMPVLVERAVGTSDKTVVTVPDGTHNDTWLRGGERYMQAVHAFIDRVAPPPHGPVEQSEAHEVTEEEVVGGAA